MSQLLYICSKNRKFATSSSPSDFRVAIEHGLCKLEKPGEIRISVVDVVMNRSWYSVRSTNNVFVVWNVSSDESKILKVRGITIPPGNYDVYELRSVLQSLFQKEFNELNVQVIYDKNSNRFTFRVTNQTQNSLLKLTFNSPVCELLGFRMSEQPTISATSPLTSSVPIRVSPDSAVYIHADLQKSKHSVIDNISSSTGQFIESDILLKIPLEVPPQADIIYQAEASKTIEFDLSTHKLDEIRLWVTDENNKTLPLVFDWTITLKLDYLEYENVNIPTSLLQSINSIRDYLKLLVLQKLSRRSIKKSKT